MSDDVPVFVKKLVFDPTTFGVVEALVQEGVVKSKAKPAKPKAKPANKAVTKKKGK